MFGDLSPRSTGGYEVATCQANERSTLVASSDWMAGLRLPDLPVRPSLAMERFVRYLTQSSQGRTIFRGWLKRSGRYRSLVGKALRDRGLPEDLQALVFLESGYVPTAVSPAGAVGIWQFMTATARIYGLTVEPGYDERRSVARSTDAAVRHLSDLYAHFGSWELTLAAYNVGYKGILRRVQELSTNDFWVMSQIDGALPKEAVLYVPKVFGLALILRNLDRFGFDDLPVDRPVVTADLEVPPGAPLAVVARASGTSLRNLRALNPEFLSSVVPKNGAPRSVHVPPGGLARAYTMLPRLLAERAEHTLDEHVAEDFDWGADELSRSSRGPLLESADSPEDPHLVFYRTTDGETLQGIARQFHISVEPIVRENHLDPTAKLQKGMLLKIQVPDTALSKLASMRVLPTKRAPQSP
jgi:membrane-bound lytic murein transglycosylase D